MVSESTLRTELASEFNNYAIRDRARVGERNTVYEVTVDGRRAACKTTESQPKTLALEGTVQAAIGERNAAPVPGVLAGGDGYLVLGWIDGETCTCRDPADRRQERLRSVGRTLAQLHDATSDWFDGHGTLQRGGDKLTVAEPVGWPTRFAAFVDEWASELRETPDADAGVAVAEAVDEHRTLFAGCAPVLIHGEASPVHVLFDGDDVAGLLDWELAQAAPGAFDLVWAERDLLGRPVAAEKYGTLRRSLVDGYASERPLGPGFQVRREIYLAAFAMRELTIVHDPDMPPQGDGDDYRETLRAYVFERLTRAERRCDAH